MSTTNGTMKSFKVTDKDGNVYVMIPVDTEARQTIDDAKNLQFDEDYFTSEVSQDQKTVNVGLNGVPLGVDSDSPLKFSQDNAQGVVISSDAPFSTSIAPEFSEEGSYAVGYLVTHDGKLYSSLAIQSAVVWDDSNWSETSVAAQIGNVESKIGSVKNGGALTDGASVTVPNNALSTLSTAQAALTLNVNVGSGEVPNFAVEVTPSVDVTLTVTKTVGSTTTTLNPSAAGGDSLTTGKLYQVTCVGSCWTLAEFTVPTP